jgi:hypothetical protein
MPPVKNVGKPCAGEPHARFDGRGLETEAIPAMVEAKAARGETPAGALRPTAEPLATAPAPDPPRLRSLMLASSIVGLAGSVLVLSSPS